MNTFNYPMPESWYTISQDTSLEELSRKFNSNEFVVGKVTFWDSTKNLFTVDLGNNIIGFLPIEETSIYPTRYPDGSLRGEAYSIIGKTICAKIINIFFDTITLSRKKNMLDSFEIINTFENEIIDCYIKSASGTMIFADIGHGISGLLHAKEFSCCLIYDVKDLGIEEKTFIRTQIKSINTETFHITLGYKELHENLSDKFNHGDILEVTSLTPVPNTVDAYFAYVNPNTSAIINSIPGLELPYASKVIARVRSSKFNKLKLSFLSFS